MVATECPQILQILEQMEAAIAKGGLGYDQVITYFWKMSLLIINMLISLQEMINDLMAQTYAASIKWPRDRVLHVRLQHIVSCVETGQWPVPPNAVIGCSADVSDPGTPDPAQANRDTTTPPSEVRTIPERTGNSFDNSIVNCLM